ncbi:MAG TPA: hypothetical protein VGC64_12110, partial [Pyrinomonadaceae bacterium]
MLRRALQLSADELIAALLRLDGAHRVQILDSGGARGPEARFLLAGFDPFEVIEARGSRACVFRVEAAGVEELEQADALSLLDERLLRYRVPLDAASQLP